MTNTTETEMLVRGQVLVSFVNSDDATEGFVVVGHNGKQFTLNAGLKDLDSGSVVNGSIRIYPTTAIDAATAHAKKAANITEAR